MSAVIKKTYRPGPAAWATSMAAKAAASVSAAGVANPPPFLTALVVRAGDVDSFVFKILFQFKNYLNFNIYSNFSEVILKI